MNHVSVMLTAYRRQDNLKRRLAFSTIGQLAYIVLGIALLTPMGVKGSILHIGAHAGQRAAPRGRGRQSRRLLHRPRGHRRLRRRSAR